MAQPAIEFKGVAKRYGGNEVLKGIDLRVEEGEVLGLVGVNGAGKTTLIKCLLDFAGLSAGTISIFGERHATPASRRRLAFVPEKFTPPYYLTGNDFIAYMSRLYGVGAQTEKVHALLSVLDLDAVALRRSVRQLSKGMSQKLGLLACLLSERPLLVMDEPMSGLDPKVRALLKSHLLELKSSGRTLFFSTHLLSDVEAMCDRLAVMHQGSLRFVGTPQACREHFGAADLEQAYLQCVAGPQQAGA